MTKRLAVALVVLLALSPACTRGHASSPEYRSEPVVTVQNKSGYDLTEVLISGSGFSDAVGSLEAGESKSLSVSPRGESGVAISFVATDTVHSIPEEGYFEAVGGYRVTVTIGPDLAVDVGSEL